MKMKNEERSGAQVGLMGNVSDKFSDLGTNVIDL